MVWKMNHQRIWATLWRMATICRGTWVFRSTFISNLTKSWQSIAIPLILVEINVTDSKRTFLSKKLTSFIKSRATTKAATTACFSHKSIKRWCFQLQLADRSNKSGSQRETEEFQEKNHFYRNTHRNSYANSAFEL